MAYWRQFWTRFRKDFLAATGEQVIGVLLAVGILFYQIRYGVIHATEVRASYWAIAWPYVFLVGVLFLWHLLRTPYLLHRESEARHVKEIAAALEHGKVAQKSLLDSLPTREQWMSLADRFNALSYKHADWYTARGKTTWSLHDATVRSLCNMAGAMLLESNLIQDQYPILLSEIDPIHRWLSYIKELKAPDRILHSEEDLPDGSKLFSYMGMVEVPKNSADICIELAAKSGGRT